MPIYSWKHVRTGTVVEVIRKFADYQIPPTREELPPELQELPEEEGDFERLIGRDIRVSKGASWGGGKGSWTLLFLLGGGLLGELMKLIENYY